jgi:hypothetical protein
MEDLYMALILFSGQKMIYGQFDHFDLDVVNSDYYAV